MIAAADPSVSDNDNEERRQSELSAFRPPRLYGREVQSRWLFEAVDRCFTVSIESRKCGILHKNPGEFIIVVGHSGSGKTALVNSLRPRLAQCGGFFLRGKFDQLQRSDQYYAIVHAMNELLEKVLEAEPQLLQRIQKSLQEIEDSLQPILELNNGLEQLIRNRRRVFPDVEPEPSESTARGTSAQKRLHFAIRSLLARVSSIRPVVLFLDDLQWAEAASVDLLADLVATRIPGLAVIGACRGSEVSIERHLCVVLRELESNAVPITQIPVGNLDPEVLEVLISDTMSIPSQQSRALADVVWRQTNGTFSLHYEF